MFGTISGATDHQPALTHAIIKTRNNLAVDLEFPLSKYCKPWYHFANPKDLERQIRRNNFYQ